MRRAFVLMRRLSLQSMHGRFRDIWADFAQQGKVTSVSACVLVCAYAPRFLCVYRTKCSCFDICACTRLPLQARMPACLLEYA